MASLDHTARSHFLVCNEPKSKSTSSFDDPLNPRSAEQERRRRRKSIRAGTALAVAVIEGMLKIHRASKRARQGDEKTLRLPLNPVQQIGLEIAIDLLHQHVDTLTPEKGG